MTETTKLRAQFGVVLFFAAIALTGCSHSDQAVQNSGTSAQVQQTAQQQAAQRAAYFNSHPSAAGGQNPGGESSISRTSLNRDSSRHCQNLTVIVLPMYVTLLCVPSGRTTTKWRRREHAGECADARADGQRPGLVIPAHRDSA